MAKPDGCREFRCGFCGRFLLDAVDARQVLLLPADAALPVLGHVHHGLPGRRTRSLLARTLRKGSLQTDSALNPQVLGV
eukprot:3665328-Rhodomonas_salina.1